MSQFTENQKEELISLRQKTAILQPDSAAREELEKAAGEYADRFYRGLKSGDAYQMYGEEIKEKIALPVPETGVGIESIINLLENEYIPPGLNVASGRHFGYIPGGGIHSAAIADYLAAVTNRYASVYASSPGAVVL